MLLGRCMSFNENFQVNGVIKISSDTGRFRGWHRAHLRLMFVICEHKSNDDFKSDSIVYATLLAKQQAVFINFPLDENETLVLASFVKPIANPGHFVPFFGVGGQDPESFYYAFSPEVLETAFNASIDRLQRAFSQQGKGVIIRATKDQIKALTAEEDSPLPFGNSYCLEKFGPCQIFSHQRDSTEFGKLYMVDPTEYVKLQELDMYISFSITSQGCMNTPFYSTRVIKIIMVVDGQGRFEMASPYEEEEGSTQIRYKKISSELRKGMVFVIPPGHPTVIIASQDESLETLNLEFYAEGNERFLLAGRGNIMKNFQKEAKELAFAISAEKVDEILDSQHLDFFMRGPSRSNHQDTATF
ncbi:hypothetical protein KSS87_015406 [Heliosperma pusillum]|nr:hypothetical protein KSS87_015406 [Heliosperma pusillum]